ncbi:hypothetical protein QBC38DRAFT_224482 [Podospora fimiseda]|uniref:Uncharacterized protein n=1 Tax=Podospora fimiseda TaxID=252190 RepID=A0AAN7BY26_9PEZI|nr:hypothetical protein QBC38DRAFT_224482 [Podospora fimiseda]
MLPTPVEAEMSQADPAVITGKRNQILQAGNGQIQMVKACVNSITHELTLEAAGRRNIMWCGNQLWLSYGDGSEINRGTCVQFFPKAVLGN